MMRDDRIGTPDGAYVELVKSLFATLPQTAIMSVAFTGVAGLIGSRHPDAPLAVLVTVGILLSVARTLYVVLGRRWTCHPDFDRPRARQVERRFAILYLGFATTLGLFTARTFQIGAADAHMLVAAMLIGYAAGVAAGIALRPLICVAALLASIVPTIIVSALMSDPVYDTLAALMAALLAGGIGSIIGRYRSEIEKIRLRARFATLARHDHLTGLPNRLELGERFAQLADGLARDRRLAIHCLDLDRFKLVNDSFGHPAGDMLLRHVADRLRRLLRGDDFAARIGGDEFVVVQTWSGNPGAAEMLAHRIARTIGESYEIDGRSISVGASVGYALADDTTPDLDRMIRCADSALCDVKAGGGGTRAWKPEPRREMLSA